MFEAVASDVSLPGRQSTAVLSLAYAFSVVTEAAVGQVLGDFPDAVWEQARPSLHGGRLDRTGEPLRRGCDGGQVRYVDALLAVYSDAPFPTSSVQKVMQSLRAAFDDQVDRWSAAERTFLEPELSRCVEASRTEGEDRSPDEPFAVTLYHAASRCMVDEEVRYAIRLTGRNRRGASVIREGPVGYDIRLCGSRHGA